MGRERRSAMDHSRGSRRTCQIDRSAWDALVFYLKHFPHTEMFGLGIGIRREDGTNAVLGTIWPKQEARSATFCQMKITDLGIIIPCIVEIRERHGIGVPIGIAAWVHTHPNLSVFLSGTDRDTYRNWSEVDPGILAIVFDVFHRQEPFMAFSPDFSRTGCDLFDHETTGPFSLFFKDLAHELPGRMRAAGRPLEALIMPDQTTLFNKHETGEYESFSIEPDHRRVAGMTPRPASEPSLLTCSAPSISSSLSGPMEARAWLRLMDSLRRQPPSSPLLALPFNDPGASRPGIRLMAFPSMTSPVDLEQVGQNVETISRLFTKLAKDEFHWELSFLGDRFLAIYPPTGELPQSGRVENSISCNPVSLMPTSEELDSIEKRAVEKDFFRGVRDQLSQAIGIPIVIY